MESITEKRKNPRVNFQRAVTVQMVAIDGTCAVHAR